MEEGEDVGEALVECYNHVLFVRVDVFETVDANTQAEEAGGEPSPPALGGPAGSLAAYGHPVWQRSSEAKDEPCRAEQYEHDCPGPEPFPGRSDSEMAAKKDARSPGGGDGGSMVRRHLRRRLRCGRRARGSGGARLQLGRHPGC